MEPGKFFVTGLLIVTFTAESYSNPCFKIPHTPHVPQDRYMIEISGNPTNYTPGENYTISLKLNPSYRFHRFTEFTLVAELEDPVPRVSAGDFHIVDKKLTTFNPECPATVIQTSIASKNSVDVWWQAPAEDNGCVIIKAIVIEGPNEWFVGGALTKKLCYANEKNEDILPEILTICTACQEAKYEVAFQGLWSRNTHPKDFPEDMWKTKLGDVIGASHKYSKSFWDPTGLASEGLTVLAEQGNTSLLETELKEMLRNNDIRTIIKARELAHPKVTGTTYTVVRVDSENHLISLVSKITPSPDWIVGVSDLELCLENGSWALAYSYNLYPWDVGTDDGLTYESPDARSVTPQLIKPIKSNSPNREESPFYDPEGAPIKPLAKLHLTRKKLYEKDCDARPETDIICPLSEWSEWSSCSVTCGIGVRTRDRQYFELSSKSCVKDETISLQETEECDTEEACSEIESTTEENSCTQTIWNEWGPCSVTCGNGTKERQGIKTSSDNDSVKEDEEQVVCPEVQESVECYNPPCSFPGMATEEQLSVVSSGPSGPVRDCKVTRWSDWSACDTSRPCHKHYQFKERYIVEHAQNGGRACPSTLRQKKRCKCTENVETETETFNHSAEEKPVDCVMGPWSEWSPCNTSCGHAVRQKIRSILQRPSKNGKPCGRRVMEKSCHLPLSCSGILPYNG